MTAVSLQAPSSIASGIRYRTAVASFFALAVVLAGGASRPDEAEQVAVRLAAIAAIAATVWKPDSAVLDRYKTLAVFAAACVLLPLLQLVPLPPSLWAALPGHRLYAEIAKATDSVHWRPLSLTPDLTINALQSLLVPVAALAVALHLDVKGQKLVAAIFVAAGLASAALGLAQLGVGGGRLRLFQHFSEASPVGLFANRNHQAALLACTLPLAAAVAPTRANERNRLVLRISAVAGALLVTAVLVLTGSRMGLVLWAAATAGTAWVLSGRGVLRRLRTRRALVGWSVATLAFAAIAGGMLLQSETFQRLGSDNFAAETRAATFPVLVSTAAAFFPTGAGFGSFDSVYRQFEPDSLLSTIYLNQAHDEPMQLLIEGGVAAISLLALFLAWWGRTSFAILRQAPNLPNRGLARAAVVVTALLMLSSCVDYPLRTPLPGSLFVFCCAEMAISRRAALQVGPT